MQPRAVDRQAKYDAYLPPARALATTRLKGGRRAVSPGKHRIVNRAPFPAAGGGLRCLGGLILSRHFAMLRRYAYFISQYISIFH